MEKRIIAINLPQFHPFKENDELWGKGFTEWTNVTKVRPRFPGHYQPHLPTETGFYDLRLPDAREMQADMAKKYGIYGFCYYHYWFNGKRLMNRPIDEILQSGQPNFPFMFCWANENWTRSWSGGVNEVLIEQKYTILDNINHIKWLCENAFIDNRYIKIEGKPVFLIYKPISIPKIKTMISTWRKIAKDNYGLDLYLVGVVHDIKEGEKYASYGFDSTMDFQPVSLNGYGKWSSYFKLHYLCGRIAKLLHSRNKIPLLISYKNYVNYKINEPKVGYKIYPCVSPGWDNSSRRVNSSPTIFWGSCPKLFKEWLSFVYKVFIPFSKEENFIFINAWNEWAEGNHLEPDRRWGTQYLEVVRDVSQIYNV